MGMVLERLPQWVSQTSRKIGKLPLYFYYGELIYVTFRVHITVCHHIENRVVCSLITEGPDPRWFYEYALFSKKFIEIPSLAIPPELAN